MKITNSHKYIIIFILFLLLVWFIWLNLNAFFVNKNLKLAEYYSGQENFEKTFQYLENAYNKKTFIDNYAGLKYIDAINNYITGNPESGQVSELSSKTIEILNRNIEIRPTYTRNWLILGSYLNISLENQTDPEKFQEIKKQTINAFEHSYKLSPKRQIILSEWAKTYIISEEFDKAEEKIEECLLINDKYGECWYVKGLINAFLGKNEESKENLAFALKYGYPTNTYTAWIRLAKAYAYTQNWKDLAVAYQRLIKFKPNNIQFYASLAYVYKEMGEIEKAKAQALKVLEIDPEMKTMVDEFLKTLK